MKKHLKCISSILAVTVLCNVLGSAIGTKYVEAYTQQSNIKTDISVGKVIHGFKLETKKYIGDIDSTVYEFQHEKTGAKLLFIKNKDENKAFRIAFKTLPKDNTGVYHIIEHCIAAGEKVGGINPYTTQIFTQYGIDSKRGKDFEKLIGDYLETLFNPIALKDEMIFMREGWRYDINFPEEELKINGVVYNEMKQLVSPLKLLSNTISDSLFPDTIDRFNSGGNPEEISKLSYEKLLETYKENYIPSNSFSFIYGNADIEKTLKVINDKHFSKFNKINLKNEIILQKPFDKMKLVEAYYPVKIDTDIKNKTYLSLNYVTTKAGDLGSASELTILENLLSQHLSKAITDKRLGELCFSSGGSSEEVFSLIIMNSEESQKEELLKTVNETLSNIVEKGFDKEKINSVINSWEMDEKFNNLSSEKVDIYLDKVLSAWLYNGDMVKNLEITPLINNIKEKSKNGYFEKLVKKYFLDNNYSSIVVLKPKVQSEKDVVTLEDKTKEMLAQYKNSLSKEELNEIINKSNKFKEWQETNVKHNIEKEPVALESINRKAEEIPTEIRNIKGSKVLSHPIYTNGVQCVNMYFDTSKVPEDSLMYLVLLTKLLGVVDTEKYNHMELNNMKNTYIRGLRFDALAFENSKDLRGYYPKLKVSMTTLDNNLEKSFEILNEVINKSKFTDKNYVRNLITGLKSELEYEMQNDIYNYVSEEALAYASDIGKYNNLNKRPFYDFICEFNKNFDKNYDEVIKRLQEIRSLAFDKDNMIVSCTGNKDTYSNFEKCYSNFIDNFKSNNVPIETYKFDNLEKNEAFVVPSEVSYVVKAGDFRKLGYKDNGNLIVANMIVWSYLRDEIRRKGGAYGAQINMYNSSIVLSSDRDPNLKATIDVFNNVGNYLRNFTADEKKIQGHIIDALNYIDYPMEPKGKGLKADEMFITGKAQEDIQKYRDEIFNTTLEDIRNCGDMMDKLMKENNLCVFGGETKLKENRDLFNKIDKLFK